MNHLKGMIFDLDGTLFDSMQMWNEIDTQFLTKRGFEIPHDYLKTVAAMGPVRAADYTKQKFGLSDTRDEIIAEWYDMAKHAYHHVITCKPHAKEYLQRMHQKGIKLGIATSCDEQLFVPTLKRCGIFDLFECYTTVAQVSHPKGHPEIYLKTAQKMGVLPHECAVFEDILAGVTGAKAGGFFAVGVQDPHSDPEAEAIMREADLYIKSFDALAL